MRADKIPDIIHQLNNSNSAYQCAMISGDWGIGKSFQVNMGIHDLKPIGYCSLFGADTIDDIFAQILFRLTFNRNKSRINLKELVNAFDLGKLDSIKKVLGNVFSPRMVLEYILNQREQKGQTTLIIFDDLERISENLDFDLFLGAVELLRQTYKYVRILFVANLYQFSDCQREIWEKYEEKVVDHVFFIDELAENIDILDTQKRNDAALGFMKQHGSKNLRTLQKAQNFFLDVSQKINHIDLNVLKNSDTEQLLWLACYSVVFESVEKIYEREGQQQSEEASRSDAKEPSYQRIMRQMIYRDIESIIYHKYLDNVVNTDGKKALIKELVDLYIHGNDNTQSIIESLIKAQNNEKPPFYCSDEEVNTYVVQQKARLENQNYANLYQFLQIVDSIFIWSPVLGLDTADVATIAKEKIPELYWECNKENIDQPWSLSIYDDHLSSDELKEILHSLDSKTKKIYYQHIVNNLSECLDTGYYSKTFDLLFVLQKFIQRPVLLDTADAEFIFSALCNDLLLPLGSCSEKQYYCEQVAYSIAMTINKDGYIRYLQSAKQRFSTDKMFLERIHQIEKSYEEAISS